MKIPFNWLKEFVDINADINEVAKRLSLSGTEVASVHNNVLEVEVLPNRGDCHSVIGIAREVSAIFGKQFKPKKAELKESSSEISSLAKVEVKDKDLCPRYMARVISGVTIKDSPAWMQKKLLEAGMRPINNIVDVTNYVMLETGQPLHAFDLDKITDKKIIVRRANEGEKITTLDGIERPLSKDNLMIADIQRSIAIGGVMGGSNSEVTASTKNILLESAYFSPVSINKTSKCLKLRTEASIRFERGIDFAGVALALDTAAGLLAQASGGSVAKGVIDIKKEDRSPKDIVLKIEKIKNVLGIDVPKENAVSILKGLGFGVALEPETKVSVPVQNLNKGTANSFAGSLEKLIVSVPLFRAGDIEREIDLIEEIIRIYGYDKLRSTFPHIQNPEISNDEIDRILAYEKKAGEVLVAGGFSEAKTYSMLGKKLFERAGLSLEHAVEITNPLIEEMTHMRTSLLPGLLEAAEYNTNRQMHDVALFEIGKVFSIKEPNEKTVVGAIIKNAMSGDLFFIKGIVENILEVFGTESIEIKESSDAKLEKGNGAEIFLTGKKIGFFGKVDARIASNFSLTKPVYVLQLDLDDLNRQKAKQKTYKHPPKFPSVRRDIAMFVPAGVTHKKIIDQIKTSGGALVEEVTLFDKFIGKGKTSLAYSVIYRDSNKTLTDEEVNSAHEAVVKSLVNELGVEIRK